MLKMVNTLLKKDAKEFSQRLGAWYAKASRRLPWRQRPSLYKTVVSEFMLQQTQVDTVLPYFERWLNVFPDFATLAAASEKAVLKQWEGLGYYSRARNLHKLAQHLQRIKKIPETPEGWRAFPGIGPYSAAAITSITFDYPIAVVDGNVIRILARLTADATALKNSGTAVEHFTDLATRLLDLGNPGNHNQAMMELGATVCMKSNPLCTVCPVIRFCAAGREGAPERFPRLIRQRATYLKVHRLWVENEGALLLHLRSHRARRLANIYELPEADRELIQELDSEYLLTTKKRGISNQRIEELIYKVPVSSMLLKKVKGLPDLEWIRFSDLDTVTLSGPHRKWINEMLNRA